MNPRPPHSARRFVPALMLLLVILLGGWGVMSLAPQSALAQALSNLAQSVFGGGDGNGDGDSDSANGSNSHGAGKGSGSDDGDGNHKGKSDGPDPRLADPAALPKGLTTIDGEGGSGFDRAVKKNGVWYPVYSPGPRSGPGAPPLTEIPLTIASASPPPGRVNQPFRYQAEAIGGTAPYTWSMTLDPQRAAASGFVLDAAGGVLAGSSAQPLKTTLNLTVTDAAGTTKSAAMILVIRPEKDLVITTASLPRGSLDQSYNATLQAEGGSKPYSWKVSGELPPHLVLDPADGELFGTSEVQGDYAINLVVTDTQGFTAEKSLTFRVGEDLEITSPPNLPSVSPGQPFSYDFKARGGVEPYVWELTNDNFPDKSWNLTPEGKLEGRAPTSEGIAEFTLRVRDAEDESFEKTFRLSVSDLLIAVPSRGKAGLAWSPTAVAGMLAGAGSPAGFVVLRDGSPVYQGRGSNFVDQGLTTGSSPEYTLLAIMPDGSEWPLGSKTITILPMSLERGIPGERGDPFADAVTAFNPLSPGGYGATQMPRNVTGPPDGRSTYAPAYKASEVLSLHAKLYFGGSIELEFKDNIVELAPGEDLTVFENVMFVGGDANRRFMEPAVVSVALFPGEWHRLRTDVVPPADGQPVDVYNPFYYNQGIAGRNPTTGDDPTDPSRSGGDSFDLNTAEGAAGLTWIRYIRIQSTGDQAMRDDNGGDLIRHNDDPNFGPLTGAGSSGFDLDAVSAVHY